MTRLSFIAILYFASPACADLACKSRPVTPPVLNLAIPATDKAADGSVSTPENIYADDTGLAPLKAVRAASPRRESVGSGSSYIGPRSENCQVHAYRGQQVLSIFEGSRNSPMGNGFGRTTILDNRHRLVQQRWRTHLVDQHGILILDGNRAVFRVFDPGIRDFCPYGATSNVSNGFLTTKSRKWTRCQQGRSSGNGTSTHRPSRDQTDPTGRECRARCELKANSSQV